MGFGAKQRETEYVQWSAYESAHWASLTPNAAMAALGSRRDGLNKAEVAERLARDGRNTLPRLRRRPGFESNRLLLIGIVVEMALLLLLIYATPLQSVFGLAPLGIEHWLLLAS